MIPARSFFVVSALAAMSAAPGIKAAPDSYGIPMGRAVPVSTPIPQIVPASAADRDKPLGVGDQVTLQILEDRTEPFARRVTDAGDIEVPYIGRVRAVGKTSSALASEIESKLEQDYYHTATVRLAIDQVNRAAALGRVSVAGEVRAPGTQEVFAGEKITVSDVILRAGSFTQFADKKNVKVVRPDGRGGNRTFEVDMKAVLEQGRVEQDMEVRDGDYIIIKRRLINW